MEELSWLYNRWLAIMIKGVQVLGPLFLIYWLIGPKWLSKFRIPQPRQVPIALRRELPLTILGLSVYLVPLYAIYYLRVNHGYSMMYLDISKYGTAYFVFSFFLFAFITDTWFYWIHRGMHAIPWLKKIHMTHHKSYNINPITSYSFHIGEAILNMLSYAFFVLVIPFHPLVLLFFGFFGLFYNGYIHLGYDIPETWRNKFPPLKLFYSASQHSIHHHEYDHNFAVYFRFWDKVMKTEKLT